MCGAAWQFFMLTADFYAIELQNKKTNDRMKMKAYPTKYTGKIEKITIEIQKKIILQLKNLNKIDFRVKNKTKNRKR